MSEFALRYQEIREFVADKTRIDLSAVEDDVDLVKAGALDSLALVNILADVENKFGVFPDLMQHDPADLTTLNRLAGVIFRELTGEEVPGPVPAAPAAGGGFDVVRLSPEHDLWPHLAPQFDAMYRHFASEGACLPLANDGARLWLDSLEGLPEKMSHIAGAVSDGALAGFISVRIKALPAFLGGTWVGEVSHLYVGPDFRRKGVASRLAETALNWLWDSGVSSVELQVVSGNAGAEEFWRSIGFKSELSQLRLLSRNPDGS